MMQIHKNTPVRADCVPNYPNIHVSQYLIHPVYVPHSQSGNTLVYQVGQTGQKMR